MFYMCKRELWELFLDFFKKEKNRIFQQHRARQSQRHLQQLREYQAAKTFY